MKEQLDGEITFLKDYGPDFKTGSAHLATVQAAAHQAFAAEAEEDEDEEGVIVLDLLGVSGEKAEILVMAARSSGLCVKPPFRMAGRKPFAWAKPFARPRPPTPPKTGEKLCANCGGIHSTQECTKEVFCLLRNCPVLTVACPAIGPRTVSNRTSANNPMAQPKEVFLGVVTAEIPPVAHC